MIDPIGRSQFDGSLPFSFPHLPFLYIQLYVTNLLVATSVHLKIAQKKKEMKEIGESLQMVVSPASNAYLNGE